MDCEIKGGDSNCLICLEKIDELDNRDKNNCGSIHQGEGICANTGVRCCKALYHVDCILSWLGCDENRSCTQCRQTLSSIRCVNEDITLALPPLAQRNRYEHADENELLSAEPVVATEAATLARLAVMFRDLLRDQVPSDADYTESGRLLMFLFCNHGLTNSFLMAQISTLTLLSLNWPIDPQPLIMITDKGNGQFQCSSTRWCMATRNEYPSYISASSFSFAKQMFSRAVFPALKSVVGDLHLSAGSVNHETSAYVMLLLLARELCNRLKVKLTNRGGTGRLTPESFVSIDQVHILLAFTIELCNRAATTIFCLSAEDTAFVKKSLGNLHWLVSRGIMCTDASKRHPQEAWILTVWVSLREEQNVIPDNSAFSLIYKIEEEEEEEEEKEASFYFEPGVPVNKSCAFACDAFQPHLMNGAHHMCSSVPTSSCRSGGWAF
jgi:hypothetical protein